MDHAGTVRLLERWEAMSPPQRIAMAQAARQCFEKRFEIGAAAERVVEVIRRLG